MLDGSTQSLSAITDCRSGTRRLHDSLRQARHGSGPGFACEKASAIRTSGSWTSRRQRGVIRCFDVSPGGRSIVFDRIQRNPELVLIDPPARR
jgi:hypothetical protein